MKKVITNQLIPVFLTTVIFFLVVGLLYGLILLLNLFPIEDKILVLVRPQDILVGFFIYIKTAIDFALFIGNLMHKYPGVKNRIAIEIGTGFGNGVGTFLILIIWTFFKEIPILMIIMIILAALVLFKMAEESIEEFLEKHVFLEGEKLINPLKNILHVINTLSSPLTNILFPHASAKGITSQSFVKLLQFSFFIPFVLGLDDFAGYIPLFTIVNVFSFATGVFLGHMTLNTLLFSSPTHTTRIVRHPLVILLGGLAFIGIGVWGIYETIHIILAL